MKHPESLEKAMRKLLVALILGAFSFAVLPAAPVHANVTKLIHKHHKHRHHHHKKPA
jgi:hypothetical protein